MPPRGTSRYGRDATGVWTRDAEGLPCYDWDPRALQRWVPGLPHRLGTGPLQAAADQWGVVSLTGGTASSRVPVTPPAPGGASALRLDLYGAGRVLRLLPLVAPEAWKPRMRYGCGYVSYGLSVPEADLPSGLGVCVTVAACRGRPYLLAEVSLEAVSGGPFACVLRVVSEVAEDSGAPAQTAARFAREGVAMASLGAGLGDAFLAGSAGWESWAGPGRLELRRSLTLEPGERVSLRLLAGYSPACSLQWLRQQFEGLTLEAVKADHARALQVPPLPGCELWLRDELTWCRWLLTAYEAVDSVRGRAIVHSAAGLEAPRTAHLLALCPFLQRVFPERVQETLLSVALRQGPEGQLPERLDGPLPVAPPDPARDRSDRETAFLWAAARWLSEDAGRLGLLGLRLPESTPGGRLFAERLMLAISWIREGIGFGPHGLVRLLAGDWVGALDAAGSRGAGESVLVSAQFCAALRLLEGVFRRAGDAGLAERLGFWRREIGEAVADAFREGAFLRGYTDTGDPFGHAGAEGVFLDVQAWAVLARCGTVTQRRDALDSVVRGCSGGPLTVLVPGGGGGPGRAVWRGMFPPGEGPNGGVSFLEAAWFLEAMALEGRGAEAMSWYQDLCLRRRCAEAGRPPYPVIAEEGCVGGPGAQAAAWWPEAARCPDSAPGAAAAAWEEETLRALLAPSPAP